MRTKVLKPIALIMMFVLSLSFLEATFLPVNVQAYGNDNPIIVVSMGDSYSSGEGIEPFYGQKENDDPNGKDLSRFAKIDNDDWLAHRSMYSWPSLLKVGDEAVREHKMPSNQSNGDSVMQWYFVAASGAVTWHFGGKNNDGSWWGKYPHKTVTNVGTVMHPWYESKSKDLDPQLKVFEDNNLKNRVDYVTMTIGGNDLGFTAIAIKAITSVFNPNSLKNLIKEKKELWDTEVKEKLKESYKKVYEAAGPQAEIIVAGYPELYYRDRSTWAAGKEQRKIIDDFVVEFCDQNNGRIVEAINECNLEFAYGKIHYVSVIEEFYNHGADAPDEWINGVTLTGTQVLDESDIKSGTYPSIHPKKEGAKAYADCVNAKIQEIEDSKKTGTLSGKICKASDRNTAISGAAINVYKDNNLYLTETSDADGNYSIELPIGRYYIKITADGYIVFNSYATVVYNTNNYMETFLMIEGSENEKGIAKGKIVNSLTGSGTDGVNLSVVKDWNNTSGNSEVVATASTDSSGYYSFELPLGNYTVIASKEGYLSTSFNIIVQTGTTDNQNGTITPKVSGDEYLITLTWEKDPRDLDSHVEGMLSDGDSFHVYYEYKSQEDGTVAMCNLDYDHRNGYGPEHITLKTTTDQPYYYYVYKYAGTGTVATSGAKVTVHKGNEQIGTYNVPTNLGSGDYWNVFAIRDGELIIKNTITDTPDTNYGKKQNGYKTVYSIPNDQIENTKNLNMVEWHPLEGLTSTMMELSTDETNIELSPDGTWKKLGLSEPMEIVNQSGTILDAAGFVMNWISNSQQITQLKVTTGKDKTIQIDYGSSFELGHSGKKTTLDQLIFDRDYPILLSSAEKKEDELIRDWFGLTGDGKYSMELKFGKVYVGDFGYRLIVENNELYQVPIVHKDSSYKVYYKEKGKKAVFVLDAANILRCTRIKLPEDEKKRVLDKLSENGFEISMK